MSAVDRIRAAVTNESEWEASYEELLALCDLADAARELIATAPGAGTSYPDGEGGSIVRREQYRSLRAALARLDGEDVR